MSRFSTRIKSLHILNNFSKLLVVDFEGASTSFCGQKSLFDSCLFTHDGASTSNKELDGFNNSLLHQQDSPIEACLAMASARAVKLSPSVQNRIRNSNWTSYAGRGRNLNVCLSAWLFTSTWYARVVCSLELLRGELSRGYTGRKQAESRWPDARTGRKAILIRI